MGSNLVAVAARRGLALVQLSQEALQLTLRHSVAQASATGAEAAQLAPAQPTTHRFRRRTDALGELADREEMLVFHEGSGGLVLREALPGRGNGGDQARSSQSPAQTVP